MDAPRSKVVRFAAYVAASSFAVWIPFWALWFRRHLASDLELTLVDVTFWVGMLVFQLPVGVIADRIGRKRTILLSEAFRTAGILGYGLGTSFLEYQVANVVWSLGAAFSIGTSAYLYEALLEAGHESEFPRTIGRVTTIQLASNAAGAFAGGLLVAWSGDIRATLLFGTVWNLVPIGIALAFVEPAVERTTEPTFVRQLVQGWHVVRRREGVALLIGLEVVLGIALYAMALFRPIYLTRGLGFSETEVALWVSGFLLVAAAVSAFAGDLAAALGEFGTLAFLVGVSSLAFVGLWGLGTAWVAVLLQAPIYVAWSLHSPLTTAFLNRRLEPGQRATVLSMGAFAFTLGLVVLLPAVGFATTTSDVVVLGLVLGLVTLVPGAYVLARWRLTVAPWPAVSPVPSRLVPGGARVSRFNRFLERMSRLRP
jgi:hypothetical protein